MSATDDRTFDDVRDRMNTWLADNPDARPELGAGGLAALLAAAEALQDLYAAMGWPTPTEEAHDRRLLTQLTRFYLRAYRRGRGTDDERRREIAAVLVGTLRALATPAQVEILDGLFLDLRRVVDERADDDESAAQGGQSEGE